MELLETYLDLTVFSILGLMAFVATWLSIERYLSLRKFDFKKYEHIELMTIDATKNLTTLSIIGANAPYVGLVGTVLGIMVTFHTMGLSDNVDTGQIMVGLSLALKATAGGIGLAIPTIIAYNSYMRKVEVLQSQFTAYQSLN
ncbi:MAG TPA: TonB-system energizer ExbB, partial [Thiomicrospira sp.]|nr:TonB-system energizer ExbB [Thiomicrospira sp.]